MKRQLEHEDLFELGASEKTKELNQKLEEAWETELSNATRRNRKPSLGRAMIAVFGRFFMFLGLIQMTEEATKVCQPLLIAGLLNALVERNTDPTAGMRAIYFAIGVSLCSALIAILHHPQFFHVIRLGMWLRVSACSLIYKKILRLNQQSMLRVSTGQIVNMMTNDVQRLDTACAFLHFIWIGPLETIFVLCVVWYQVGVAALAGVFALFLMSPIQYLIARIFARIRAQTAALTDERVKLTSEMIHGMRVVKMYSWEAMFLKIISKVRWTELKRVLKTTMFSTMNITQYMVHTKLVMLVFMGCVVATTSDGEVHVTVSNIFLVLCLVDAIRTAMSIEIPMAAQAGAAALISLRRIQKVLLLDEMDTLESINSEEKRKPTVSIDNFSASWESDAESPTLSGINLKVDKPEIIGVVGPVGCGKSSLLMALLGELPAASGSCKVTGSVAYVAQLPWVFGATIRQNVVFGRKWNKKLYEASIRAASLDKDLLSLPHGDQTLVGERGVSLSGGQKARVALARGLYSNADVYLLDDPLSAVDTAVGKFLFHKCICKYLKDKIRILVTHQMQFLQHMDRVIVLQGGEVLKSGTYDEVMNCGLNLEVLLAHEMTENSQVSEPNSHQTSSSHATLASIAGTGSCVSLPDDCDAESECPSQHHEERATGSISFRVYYKYFTAGANCFLLFLLFLLFVATQSIYILCDWWLTVWMKWERIHLANATDSLLNGTDPFLAENIGFVRHFDHSKTFLWIFGLLTLGVFISSLARSVSYFCFTISASYTLHKRMIRSLVYSTTQFFDTNPVGRILNRFSKDVGVMDEMLPPCLSDFFICSFLVIGNLVVNFVISPWTIVGVFPLVIIFVFLRQYYMRTSRSVKRLEAIARSPVFSHLNNTLLGLATVRSSGSEELFIHRFFALQDEHNKSWFAFLVTSRWFGIRLDWLCVSFVFVSCTASVTVKGLEDSEVGLMLTYAVGLLGIFQWCVRQSTEVENNMVSLERVIEYTELKQEPPLDSPSDKYLPEGWPAVGALEFRNVNFRYSPETPVVLKNISFKVQPREKIGIVGRTGAGKSSLIYCLFRLSELDEGAILIDAQPTGPPMGLHKLRSNISIIPQDPVLFTGTVRWNLDPSGRCDDETLWHALDDVQMRESISAMNSGLDAKVAESGVNLSVGQRQLMCLARALLVHSKILVIDEATANVDPATDALIQQTIRTKFSNCTVLTIAHRLQTIMDSDRVMVLDSGQVVEFSHPKKLIDREDSYFADMINQLDTEMADTLHGIAQASYLKRESGVHENGLFVTDPRPSTLEILPLSDMSRLSLDGLKSLEITEHHRGQSTHSCNVISEVDEEDIREPLV